MHYFEDIEVGDVLEVGSYEVTEEETLEFAEQYDPQPFHIDPEAANESMFGGLIASGWHTTAMTMRMLVEGFVGDVASRGAKGVDELRWYRPVRPGDTLSVRTEVLETEADHPERGTCRVLVETINQDGTVVQSFVSLFMIARRDGEE